MFLISKCRGDWDLGLCTTSVLALEERMRDGKIREKNVFQRRKNRSLPLRCGSPSASSEVVHRPRSQSPLHFDIRNIWISGPRPSFNGDSMPCLIVQLLVPRPKKPYNSSTSTPKHQRKTWHLRLDCDICSKLTNTSGAYTAGFWNSSLHPTKMECCVMLVIDKGPNKGLLFDPNTVSNLGHPVGF